MLSEPPDTQVPLYFGHIGYKIEVFGGGLRLSYGCLQGGVFCQSAHCLFRQHEIKERTLCEFQDHLSNCLSSGNSFAFRHSRA